jgi:hypothetical protein
MGHPQSPVNMLRQAMFRELFDKIIHERGKIVVGQLAAFLKVIAAKRCIVLRLEVPDEEHGFIQSARQGAILVDWTRAWLKPFPPNAI